MPKDTPDLINASAVIRLFKRRLGKGVNHGRLREFVHQRGLPAYENTLRLNREGEPTLLFKESEVNEWLERQLRPVNTVPQG
jgi:hypothetical protein